MLFSSLNDFYMLILKIKNLNKNYFNIFLIKKYFKKYYTPQYQIN